MNDPTSASLGVNGAVLPAGLDSEQLAAFVALVDELVGEDLLAEEVSTVRQRLTSVDEAEALPAFPNYEVVDVLGRGGTADVYRARDRSLGRTVALKVLARCESPESEVWQRFRAEAATLARLRHPHIVQVFEVGEVGGRLFLALEYVEGGTLAQRLAKEPQPSRAAAALAIKLARAVQAAHDQGVVHRDLKPANVLLAGSVFQLEEADPKIGDFGLAKWLTEEPGRTGTGAVLGTPSYMPPEQAGGAGAVGPAADIYALGAILYETLSGRPPFQGATPLDILDAVRRDEPLPPSRLQPAVPRDLEIICLKCLEKEARQRYATAGDLADDLRRFLDGVPIRARPAGRVERAVKWARRHPARAFAVAAASCLFAAVLGLLVSWYRIGLEQAERQAAEQTAIVQKYQRLVFEAAEILAAPATPGSRGRALALLEEAARLAPAREDRPRLRSLVAQALARIDLEPVAVLGKGTHPSRFAFSPDGGLLAVGENRSDGTAKVLIFDAATREEVGRLTLRAPDAKQVTGVRGLAFDAVGTRLAVAQRDGQISLWDVAQRQELRCWKAHQGDPIGLLVRPGDGAIFSFGVDKTLKCWDADTGRLRGERSFDHAIQSGAFLPDGSVFAGASNYWLRIFSGPRLEDEGVPLLYSDGNDEIHGVQGIAFTPDKLSLVIQSRLGLQWLRLFSAKPSTPLAKLPRAFPSESRSALEGWMHPMAFTPDGAFLLGAANDRRVRVWDVAAGRLALTVALTGFGQGPLALSPDGQLLACGANEESKLYEVRRAVEEERVAHHSLPVRGFAYSRDGRRLACVAQHHPRLTGHVWGEGSEWLGFSPRPERHEVFCANGNLGRASVAWRPDGTGPVLTLAEGEACLSIQPGSRPHSFERHLGASAALYCPPSGDALWGILKPLNGHSEDVDSVVRLSGSDFATTFRWTHSGPGLRGLTCLAAGDRRVVVGMNAGATLLFEPDTSDQPRCRFEAPDASPVESIALSPDEELAAVGCRSGVVQVLRLNDHSVLWQKAVHRDTVSAVAFHRGGNLLATGSDDTTVRLWRRQGDDFVELHSLPCPDRIAALAFRPESDDLTVLVRHERALRVWHLDLLRKRFAALGLDEESP